MNTVKYNSNKNSKAKFVSDILNQKAKEIFKSLCNELQPGSTVIDLETLRNALSANSKKGNFKPEIVDMISKYRLIDMIKEDKIKEKNYNLKINEREFCDFITGVNLKNTLFNKNIVGKTNNVEDLYAIYNILGGDNEGVSKSKLNRNIAKALKLMNDPNVYLKDDFNPDSVPLGDENEVQQILNLLATTYEDKLSLQDFINAMSCDYTADLDCLISE